MCCTAIYTATPCTAAVTQQIRHRSSRWSSWCFSFITFLDENSTLKIKPILTRRGKPRPSPVPKFCNKKQLLCQLQYQFQIIHYVMFSHFWPYPTDLIILFLKFYTICWSKVGPYTTVCTLYRELLPWITPVRISLKSEILTVWTILTMWTILDKFYQVLVTAN